MKKLLIMMVTLLASCQTTLVIQPTHTTAACDKLDGSTFIKEEPIECSYIFYENSNDPLYIEEECDRHITFTKQKNSGLYEAQFALLSQHGESYIDTGILCDEATGLLWRESQKIDVNVNRT